MQIKSKVDPRLRKPTGKRRRRHEVGERQKNAKDADGHYGRGSEAREVEHMTPVKALIDCLSGQWLREPVDWLQYTPALALFAASRLLCWILAYAAICAHAGIEIPCGLKVDLI